MCVLNSSLSGGPDTHRVLQTITRLPTQEERARLLRYASWIRQIRGVVTRRFEGLFDVLQFSSPTETPFYSLRVLSCCVYPSSLLRSLPLFLSPQLTTFSVSVYPDAFLGPGTTGTDHLSAAVAALPTSLRELTLAVNRAGLGSDELKKEVLNTIQQCRRTLARLEIDVELPTVAIHHAMQLPNLCTWRIHQSSLPDTLTPFSETTAYLPSIRSLTLSATNTHDWVIFLASSFPAVNDIRSTLTELNLSGRHTLDQTLLTQICAFTSLRRLDVGSSCPPEGCVFSLDDGDLSHLSLALPQLESLMLGHQCDKNTCRTTFRSLLFLSARCPNLALASIHFNTLQLAQDIKSLFGTEDPGLKELRDSPTRCRIRTFAVQTPLSLNGPDELALVKNGFLNVFPQLKEITGRYRRTWQGLTSIEHI